MHIQNIAVALTAFCTVTAVALPNELAVRGGKSNKPVVPIASAAISVYTSYSCTSLGTPPSVAGTTSSISTVTVSENQCANVNIPLGGAITAKLTAPPKTGTAACYVQSFTQSGCGLTLSNLYVGYPFDGIAVGNQVGCANGLGNLAYGAVELVCA